MILMDGGCHGYSKRWENWSESFRAFVWEPCNLDGQADEALSHQILWQLMPELILSIPLMSTPVGWRKSWGRF
jgi:hypothetical protein